MFSKQEVYVPTSGLMASGGFWALAYSFISISITLFNKAVLSSFVLRLSFNGITSDLLSSGFSSAMTLTLLQGLFTIVALRIMKRKRLAEIPDFRWDVAKKVAPMAFVFIAYVVISLFALDRVNVPMFTALRRLTILFVMVEEYFMLGISPNMKVVQTVIVMVIGAALAAARDMTFDPVSYFYLFLTNLFTSLYTVYISKVKKETGLKEFAMLYYSNILTMPFLLILAIVSGDLSTALSYKGFWNINFQINFQASIFLAFFLNISTFYCTSLNSARTQTVVGQLKNFFSFLLGLVLFNDYVYDHLNMLGLLIGFAGGVWYAYITFAEKSKPKVQSSTHSEEEKENIILDTQVVLDEKMPMLSKSSSEDGFSIRERNTASSSKLN